MTLDNQQLVSLRSKATSSMWDHLILKPQRRALSKLRWKVLQRGECIDAHWNQLRELWQIENPELDVSQYPQRVLEQVTESTDPKDGTTKWLLKTHDDHAIESVLIPSSKSNRATACISSQVGCGVRCSFCATGTLGLIRNLTAAEVLEQVMVVRTAAATREMQLRNVVFMGMGEPLHNWPNVREAIDFLLRDDGFYFSPSHVCVSTAGVITPLLQCARDFPKLRIAISLHSCNPEVRPEIVPRGVGSLDQIRNAIVQINQEFPDRTIWLELVMLKDQTDRDHDIDLLLEFVRGLNIELNLIPYNSAIKENSQGTLTPERSDRIWEIAQRLRGEGIFTTIRYSGGQNIAAACGQLAAQQSSMQGAR